MTLSEIFAKHSDTDKDTIHSYAPIYEELLKDRRESIKSVLEVGVRSGGSLRSWAEYLPNSLVHGIDNWSELKEPWVSPNPNRILPHWADQTKPETIYAVAKVWGPFDFILDDAGHSEQTQIATYAVLRPHLNSGGIYVIEDCEGIEIAKRIATLFGGQVIDRRAVKNRHDDILVVFRT